MTAIPQPGAAQLASERITRPLRAVATRQRKLAAAKGGLQALAFSLLLVLAASLLLGYLLFLPHALRIALAALTWATVLATTIHFLRPALARRTLAGAAFAVERRTAGLHERLSSAVELATESDPFLGSPTLVRHLVGQAESDAAAVRPETILPADDVKRWGYLLIPVVALWLTLSVLVPRPLFAGLYRVLMPWRDHLPVMLTTIAVTPGEVTLAEGDTLEIRATVNARSGRDRAVRQALLLTRANDAGNNVAGTADRPLARDLERLAPTEFKASLPDLHQTFAYRVSTDAGDSAWFTANVLPRPSVSQLDLHYAYPPYAGLDPKDVPNSDGAIKALQGTDVTLAVHTQGDLDLGEGKSRVTVAEGPRQRDVPLKSADGRRNVYEAKLTVFNSGSYHIHLVNGHGLMNKDDPQRPILADLDQPPKISITAPASDTSVRPDDDVPIAFAADDDFGVARLQAVVQVDDKPEQVVDVNLSRHLDRRRVVAEWTLSVPAHLSSAGVADAKRITYWLKAADNRDPDPQSAESAKQTLKIDAAQPLSYKTRLEQQHAKDLVREIDRAIQRLQQSDWAVNSLKDIDRNRPMNADEKTRAKEHREQLATTSSDLAEAAESNLHNAFSAVAVRAKEIADEPIQGAAENVARSLLSAEQPEPRARAAAEAARQMADARKQLEELKQKVEARAKELQAARELEKLAQKQTELAKSQRQAPDAPKKSRDAERERLQRRQRELAERLGRAVGESEALREPKATEQAARLRELIDRVEQLQKDAAPLKDQLARQQQVSQLEAEADGLAEQQAKLNQELAKYADAQRVPLERADARAPDPGHQAEIVDKLRRNEPRQAYDRQRQTVDQLKQAAKQLQERGRSRDLRPDPLQQDAIERREQAKRDADQAAQAAKQAADQLRQAIEAKNAEKTASAQKAVEQSAQAMTEQARAAAEAVRQAAASDDATAKKNAAEAQRAADAAQAAAEAARQAAQQGDAPQAAKKLDEAGKQLTTAQKEALDGTRDDFVANQQAASKAAAERARQLAQRQSELAEATMKAATALDDARRDQPSPQDVAARQNQLKDQAQQTAQQADQLEHLADQTNPALARRAAAAEQQLREASTAEAQAEQAEQSSARAQNQADQANQQAAEAGQESAQLDQRAARHVAQAAEQQQQAQVAEKRAADAQAGKDEAAAKAAHDQAAQARQQYDRHTKRTDELKQQSDDAAKRAAAAAKRADAAEKSASAAEQQSAAKHQSAAEALARAEDALRDLDRLAENQFGQPKTSKNNNPSAPTDSARDQSAQPDAQESQQADGSPAAAPKDSPPALTPEQAMRRAAQGAQEAAQAQQQAISNGADPGAVSQAAAALQQAASAMAAATASPESSESAAAGADEQAEAAADAAGARRAKASANASSRDFDSRTGTGTGTGSHDGRPQSVQQLGISAGDWARLAPLQRQELLNAAQQTGPPAYREMIKNYYVKIARFGRNEATNK